MVWVVFRSIQQFGGSYLAKNHVFWLIFLSNLIMNCASIHTYCKWNCNRYYLKFRLRNLLNMNQVVIAWLLFRISYLVCFLAIWKYIGTSVSYIFRNLWYYLNYFPRKSTYWHSLNLHYWENRFPDAVILHWTGPKYQKENHKLSKYFSSQ